MKLALSSLLALALSGTLLSGCGDNAGDRAGTGATGSSGQTTKDRSATTPRKPGGAGGAGGGYSGGTK